jgi:hypothetical protein
MGNLTGTNHADAGNALILPWPMLNNLLLRRERAPFHGRTLSCALGGPVCPPEAVKGGPKASSGFQTSRTGPLCPRIQISAASDRYIYIRSVSSKVIG